MQDKAQEIPKQYSIEIETQEFEISQLTKSESFNLLSEQWNLVLHNLETKSLILWKGG